MKSDISKTSFLEKDISQKTSSPHFWPLDDPPGQVNVLQAKGLDLLPVFCFHCEVHREQQIQIVSQP